MSTAHARFGWAALSALAAELVLFAGGLSWLAVLTHSVSLAIRYGLYWFVFAEVIKVLMAAAVAARWHRKRFVRRLTGLAPSDSAAGARGKPLL